MWRWLNLITVRTSGNIPMTTINKMYDEEVMRAPSEEEQAEEENFIEGGLKAAKEFNSTFMPAAEANKLEVGDEPATC